MKLLPQWSKGWLCYDFVKFISAKLQNTPQLWSASLTCVGRLWRSRHNTIDAILIQWHVNELRGILKLLLHSPFLYLCLNGMILPTASLNFFVLSQLLPCSIQNLPSSFVYITEMNIDRTKVITVLVLCNTPLYFLLLEKWHQQLDVSTSCKVCNMMSIYSLEKSFKSPWTWNHHEHEITMNMKSPCTWLSTCKHRLAKSVIWWVYIVLKSLLNHHEHEITMNMTKHVQAQTCKVCNMMSIYSLEKSFKSPWTWNHHEHD